MTKIKSACRRGREKVIALSIVIAGFLTSFLIVFLARAQEAGSNSLTGKFIEGKTISEWINMVYIWGTGIVGVLAVLVLVFAGITYIISAGNPEMINKAKAQITAALAGVVILLLSYTILHTIDPQLTKLGFTVTKLELPTNPIEMAQAGAKNSGTAKGKDATEAKKNCKEKLMCQGLDDNKIDVKKNADGSWECTCAQGSKESCETETEASEENCKKYSGALINCVFEGEKCVPKVNEEQKKKLKCKLNTDCPAILGVSNAKCNLMEGENKNLCYISRNAPAGESCENWPGDYCKFECNIEILEVDHCTGESGKGAVDGGHCNKDTDCDVNYSCIDTDGWVNPKTPGALPQSNTNFTTERCYPKSAWPNGAPCEGLKGSVCMSGTCNVENSANIVNLGYGVPDVINTGALDVDFCEGPGIPSGGWCDNDKNCASGKCVSVDHGEKCQ